MRPLQWWAESAPPPGGDRVKVTENLGATSVAPVAPVDTSLGWANRKKGHLKITFMRFSILLDIFFSRIGSI